MTIGNKKHISFELDVSDKLQELSNLYFYLGNRLISNESVYTTTYIASFENFIKLLEKEQFQNGQMENLNTEQRFKKLVQERDSDEFQYLKHQFLLDESIDQYTIFVFQSKESTDIVWSCWDEYNCNSEHELKQIYSASIPTEELSVTVNKLTEELKKRLANNTYK